jgi:hypothetical protein
MAVPVTKPKRVRISMVIFMRRHGGIISSSRFKRALAPAEAVAILRPLPDVDKKPGSV